MVMYSRRVIQSKNKDYEVGTLAIAFFGWRTHTVMDPAKDTTSGLVAVPVAKLDPTVFSDDISSSTALGILGMTG